IRLAAIRRGPHQVEVCLRSDETDFQVDHFRALCCFSGLKSPTTHGQNPASTRQVAARPSLRLDPSNDLYGRILFHQGRFCRVSGYRTLKARECFAEITTDGRTKWFGPYRPEGFVLGDPGARDAALHAIQACIPHQRILPAAIGRVEILDTTPGIHFVAARETSRNGSTFIYNLEIMNQQGRVVERWSELTLRAIEPMSARASWPAALAVPYFERRLEELLPERLVSVAMEHNGRGRKAAVRLRSETEQSETTFFFAAGRTASSNSAMKAALGRPARIWRRPDGKPVMWAARQPWPAGQLRAAGAGSGGRTVSAAHQDALTLAIASQGQVACDLEAVVARPEPVWHQLLGNKHCSLAARISRERSESIDSASTRIWTVLECLKKAGLPVGAPLVLESAADDGWLVLRSGTIGIASCILAVQGMKNDMAIAFALSDMPVAAC
ncbi:MAG TPA: polyketide synthase dehydratase domain-containing protein, partial [Candidatus Dormibacteraeota bacterium]|nr:polyketide synthase dehydratase domain-containing protein [Candidatus Dormibacteraeota bacterium]